MQKQNTKYVQKKKKQNTRPNVPRSFGAGDTIIKMMSFPEAGFTASAGGAIVVTSVDTTAVQSTPATEWASFAARYQQYRVRSVMLKFTPANVSTFTGVGCGRIFVADYIGTSVPATAAQVLSDERSRIHDNMKEWTFVTTHVRNPNADLWNPTSAIIPAANSYAIVLASPADYGATQAIGFLTVRWMVELRGSQ